MKKIRGSIIDKNGRCIHYDSSVDIAANNCYFCKRYYACYQCHDNHENHRFVPWPIRQYPDAKVVLCGACYYELTYEEYSLSKCINCGHLFNLNCSKHEHIYFEREDPSVL